VDGHFTYLIAEYSTCLLAGVALPPADSICNETSAMQLSVDGSNPLGPITVDGTMAAIPGVIPDDQLRPVRMFRCLLLLVEGKTVVCRLVLESCVECFCVFSGSTIMIFHEPTSSEH